MINCAICGKDFPNQKSLHLHLRVHKKSPAQYYTENFPRYDRYTQQSIPYKSFEHYFSTDFNDRNSFAKWCQFHEDEDEVKKLVRDYLTRRKEEKGLKYFPHQVELKSIMLPSLFGLKKVFGEDWQKEVRNLGLELKFDYDNSPVFEDGSMVIYQDTREQTPLKFEKVEVMKLSAGDYTCSEPFYSDVFVERKSIQDLVGTLTRDSDRFEKELVRAKDLGYYIVVVVDASYQNLLDYSPKNSFSSIVTGRHVLFQIRRVLANFDNIQFVFSGDRERSVEVIEKIFRMKERVKDFDLEYLKDGGLL